MQQAFPTLSRQRQPVEHQANGEQYREEREHQQEKHGQQQALQQADPVIRPLLLQRP